MSDTFPDETLYPVLESLADEDRIFASNSADGHESSQLKGSTIKGLINALKGTPPETLDTLAKLAAAINDDPNFHATLTLALAGKQGASKLVAGGSLTINPAQINTCYNFTGAGSLTLPNATTVPEGSFVDVFCQSSTATIAISSENLIISRQGVSSYTLSLSGFGNTVRLQRLSSYWFALWDATPAAAQVAAQYQAKWTYSFSGVGGAISATPWTMHGFGASGTLTLPLASSVASGVQVAAIVVTGGAEVVLTRSGSDQFVTPTGLATTYTLRGNGSSIVLVRVTASAWACVGAPDSLINAAIAPLAPLASPALTGTPTAPTAAAGTNTTQLATTAFVTGALAGVSGVPAGVICMWSGTIATVPSGWALCDGANGTPDLVDRFVVAAGSKAGGDKYNPGDTGGLDSVTLDLTQVPAHTHSGTTGSAGQHRHAAYVPFWGGTAGSSTMIDKRDSAAYKEDQPEQLIYTDYSLDHTHTFTTDSKGGGGSHENRPPYYALAFIMKL